MIAKAQIAGLVFAGGRSSRFPGGAKEEALLHGKRMIDHVIERAAPQVSALAISRAEAPAQECDRHASVIDIVKDRGPLSGLHAGLMWAASLRPPVTHLASFPCDTPYFPETLVAALADALERANARAAIIKEGDDVHPTFGLWSVDLAPLAERLLDTGPWSLRNFADEAKAVSVEMISADALDFANVNTRADLDAMEQGRRD